MPKAYILASKGKSFISKLIKRYQRGFPYTHIAYVLNIRDRFNPLVIEAWHLPFKFTFRFPFIKGGGVYKYRFSEQHTPGTEFTIFSIEVTNEQKEKIENFLLNQLGKEYDFKGIFGFASYSDLQDTDKWFCSELVFAAFKYAGVELLKNIEPYKVSPRIFLLSPFLKKEFDSILIK